MDICNATFYFLRLYYLEAVRVIASKAIDGCYASSSQQAFAVAVDAVFPVDSQ